MPYSSLVGSQGDWNMQYFSCFYDVTKMEIHAFKLFYRTSIKLGYRIEGFSYFDRVKSSWCGWEKFIFS